jgi:hypothetical protein
MSDPRHSSTSIGYVAIATVVGAAIGWFVGNAASWSIVGAVTAAGTTAMIHVVGVRAMVAIPVAIGAGVGTFLGGTIVGVLCEPDGCPAFEASAAIVTGIGALVGVGLVVALATRSFDEYHEAVDRGREPPTTGCGGSDNQG